MPSWRAYRASASIWAGVPLLFQRFMVHNDAVSTVAEGRHYGAKYLRQVATLEASIELDEEAVGHIERALQ